MAGPETIILPTGHYSALVCIPYLRHQTLKFFQARFSKNSSSTISCQQNVTIQNALRRTGRAVEMQGQKAHWGLIFVNLQMTFHSPGGKAWRIPSQIFKGGRRRKPGPPPCGTVAWPQAWVAPLLGSLESLETVRVASRFRRAALSEVLFSGKQNPSPASAPQGGAGRCQMRL